MTPCWSTGRCAMRSRVPARARGRHSWKRNCPIKLLEEALRAKSLLPDAEKAQLLREIETEIDECFRFAKSSPFPSAPDWASINYSSTTPEADRLLAEIDLDEFDAHQESA